MSEEQTSNDEYYVKSIEWKGKQAQIITQNGKYKEEEKDMFLNGSRKWTVPISGHL